MKMTDHDMPPHEGNPHVRFDDGEVASAATPRRGSLLLHAKLNLKVRMELITLVASTIAVIGVTSAGTCTWKSSVGSGKWSEQGNWEGDSAPVAGDVVVLQSDVAGAVITNDIGEMSIAGLQLVGLNGMTLSGPKLTLTGSLITRNASVINCDLHVSQNVSFKCGDRPNSRNEFPQTTCEPTFNGNITIADGRYLYVTGDSGAQFNGTVTGTGAYIRNGTINWSSGAFHFNRPVSVKEIQHYEADQSKLYFNAAGNHYEKFTSSYTYYYFTVANAMAPEGVIAFNNSGALDPYRGYFLYADQTINRFDGSTNPGSKDGHWFAVSDESRHIEVVAKGTADGSSYVRLVRKMGFTWAPTGNYTQEFIDRAHTIEGPIVVSNGTIKLSGTCSFKKVGRLTVRKNAMFHHASTEAEALKDVTLVTLEEGAMFKVDAGASNPFTKSPTFIMGRNAKIDIADGASISIGDVQTPSGTFPATGTYTGSGATGTRVDWVSGEGTVNVTASGIVAWSRAEDGDFNDTANWNGGNLPVASKPAYITANGADYTVTLDAAPAADAGGLRLANDGEHTNVLAVSAAATFSGETVEVSAGGRIEVNEGGRFVYRTPNSYGENTKAFFVHDGGRVELNGGYLESNSMNGKVALESDGVLAIHAGTCRVHNAWAGNGLWVYPGGRIAMDGGVLDLYLYTGLYRPLTLAGGTMDVCGDATVKIGNGLGLYFGDGDANFYGNARLSYDQSVARLAVSPRTATDVTRLTFTGNSALDMNGAIGTYVGFNAPEGSRATLRYASSATSHAGAICSVGDISGYGELDIESGCFSCGSYGIFIGANVSGMISVPDGVRPEGLVKVSGGVLSFSGQQSVHDGGHVLYGIVVGHGTDVSNGVASTSFHKGTLEITDGVVSNIHGFTSVGVGKAKGVVRQTGGTFVSLEPGRTAIIGSFGGDGEWIMDGGTVSVPANLYVGGCTLTDFNRSSNYPVFGIDSGSQGRLSITNGSFSVGWAAYLGKNGTGLLELGTGGVFHVSGSLDVRAGGTLKFVVGPNGTGLVRANGSLLVDESARLVIDASAFDKKFGRYRFVEVDGSLGQFSPENVEVVGLNRQGYSLSYRNKVLSCALGSVGFTLSIR